MKKPKELIFTFELNSMKKGDGNLLVIKILFKGFPRQARMILGLESEVRIPEVENYEILSKPENYEKYFEVIKDETHLSGRTVAELGFTLEIHPKRKNDTLTVDLPEKAKWINQKIGIWIKVPFFSLYWNK